MEIKQYIFEQSVGDSTIWRKLKTQFLEANENTTYQNLQYSKGSSKREV
jgi:hypothetical protein